MRQSRGNICSLVECVRVLLLGPLVLCVLLMSGCNTLDERDICCEEVVIDFRYSRGARDEFPKYIKGMHYYIFDEQGVLLRQAERGSGEELQHFRLTDVPSGKYTVVAVGNARSYTQLSGMEVGLSTLTQFHLLVNHMQSDISPFQGDSDPLYYGILHFKVLDSPIEQRFTCDMSNVHCLLMVTVRWKETQPVDRERPFELRLQGVPIGYHLSHSYPIELAVVGGSDLLVHRFPLLWDTGASKLGNHMQRAPYLAGRVRAELRTLRYYDDWVPTLSIWQGGREVMLPIRLEKVFKEFRWLVSGNVEQRYEIEVWLYDDGRVEVRPGGKARVLDWVDGGVVG